MVPRVAAGGCAAPENSSRGTVDHRVRASQESDVVGEIPARRVDAARRGRNLAPGPTSSAYSRAAPIAPLANALLELRRAPWRRRIALGPRPEIAGTSVTPVGIIQVKYRPYNPFFPNVDERHAIGLFNATDINIQ